MTTFSIQDLTNLTIFDIEDAYPVDVSQEWDDTVDGRDQGQEWYIELQSGHAFIITYGTNPDRDFIIYEYYTQS